jgi:hypothetical protein
MTPLVASADLTHKDLPVLRDRMMRAPAEA